MGGRSWSPILATLAATISFCWFRLTIWLALLVRRLVWRGPPPLTRAEALAAARSEAERRGYRRGWAEPVYIQEQLLWYGIMTDPRNRGGYIYATVNAFTGAVTRMLYAPKVGGQTGSDSPDMA